MEPVCIVSPPKSKGARALATHLANTYGVNTARSQTPVEGMLNIGWGRSSIIGLNKKLPPNKLWELERCLEKGVTVVPFWTKATDVPIEQDLVVWGRKLNHTQGLDIIQYGPGGPLTKPNPPRDFYTALIQKTAEFRVHVFDGLAVRSGTKIPKPGINYNDTPIWNLGSGFEIRYEHPAPERAKTLAKAAVSALDLNFAAVDVVQDNSGQCYFLEANTKPGLYGQTLEKYARKIALKAGWKETV